MKTRFAPSPTGYLHLGNIRTALLCWLYAKKMGGEFILRVDDTDRERSKESYIAGIRQDLEWLGLSWDKIFFQSERFDLYNDAIEKLKKDGRLYACYETPEELEVKRKMQLSRGQPPIYDRAGLEISNDQRQKYEEEGRKPHYRFLLNDEDMKWEDEVRGSVHFEGRHMSDPILVRENGAYTYMLPSTVDDIDMGITNVLRGEDHVSNTAIQIQIFKALGGEVPGFAHNALIHSKEGKLSKRKGQSSIKHFREEGIEPMAINSFLAKIGSSDPVEIKKNMEYLVQEFDMGKFSKSPTQYSNEEIERLNSKLLHILSFEEVKEKLQAIGSGNIDQKFWEAVKPNINSLEEVKTWWKICRDHVSADVVDGEFTKQAAELLPPEPWDKNTWKIWSNLVKEKTGRKGKELFMPLRKALTGMDHGPEMSAMLPLMGRETIEKRLKQG